MDDRDLQEEFNKLREVIQAGFVLVATELEMNRNADKPAFSVDTALKSASQLMNTLNQQTRTAR